MSLRALGIQIHVLLACGVLLAWLLALTAHAAPWRRHHARIGRCFVALVLASSVGAVALALDSRNRFGVLFALQPVVLALSAVAQFAPRRWQRRVLGGVGLLVALGVLAGFVRFLASRALIDVAAFAWTALTLGWLAARDVGARDRPARQAHAHRMLAAGWFYLAELVIFVVDPHPSVIAWALAAALPAGLAWRLRRSRGPRTLQPAPATEASRPALSAGPAPRQ